MRFSATEIAAIVDGSLDGPDVMVDSFGADSRTLNPGSLFVAIKAERDGHDFIPHALNGGAFAYLSSRPSIGGTCIRAENTLDALWKLAAEARNRLPERVIGITGSVGKTTVKDLTASALQPEFSTAFNIKSFNNELGVPLTLLNAASDSQAAVIEIGARGRGHIAALVNIVRPTISVVTEVALAHTELFGSIKDVATAKGELVEGLSPSGTAVLNSDNPLVLDMRTRTRGRVLTFGRHDADVTAEDVEIDEHLRPRYQLRSPWGSVPIVLSVAGEHQVMNSLAASAAALAAGGSLERVADGLAKASLSPMRMDILKLDSGAIVINDCYNANPASMAAALKSLLRLPARRRIALVGLMAELGDVAPREHTSVRKFADENDIELVAIETDLYGADVRAASVHAAVQQIEPLSGDVAVLVKASRSVGLERVIHALLTS